MPRTHYRIRWPTVQILTQDTERADTASRNGAIVNAVTVGNA